MMSVEVGAGFDVLEDGSHVHARSPQHPRAAHVAGNALHGGALRPIETAIAGLRFLE